MKLNLDAALKASNTLGTLNNTRGMPTVVAYRISKLVKALSKELEEYEAQRKKLCEEYSKKDDEGKPIVKDGNYDITLDDLKIINEELEKLRNETIELEIKKVTLDDINKAGLAPAELELIEFMLDLEEE